MGISDLQTLIETDPVLSKAGVSNVDLVKTAWNNTNGGLGGSTPNRLALVLDGESCLDRLYGGYYSDWGCGGQWNHMLEFMSVLFQTLGNANIHTATFLNGCLEPTRFQDWVTGQLKLKQNVRNVLRHLHKRGTPPPKVWWVPPTGIRSVVRLALRHLGLPVMCSVESHALEVVSFLRENGYHGILGDNSEYCIFDPPRYYSAHKMKLTLKFTLETQEIVMDEIAKSFDLNPNRFSLMAALLGNQTLTESELRQFHSRLIPEMDTSKVSHETVIRAVVNYIRTLVNIDDIDALGTEIFGSSADPRIVKLKEVVEYYNSGTEDGYKKYRPSKKKKKEAIHISTLASDTAQAESESQELYNHIIAGRKVNNIIVKETNETIDGLASLSLVEENDVKDTALDSMEAIAAVASNSVKPSENGKYPTKETKDSPIKDKATIPLVNSEVIKTAAERHRQACMSPYLYNLLTTGEILLPVLMEEENGDIGGIHLIYRELRQRVYGIVFNLHHFKFTKQKNDEELKTAKRRVEEIVKKLGKVKSDSIILKNNEPRSEREVLNEKLEAATLVVSQLAKSLPSESSYEINVREWLPYNKFQQPELVVPSTLSWPVPTVQRLWFGTGLEDKQRRLRAYLSIMSSDSHLMLQTNHVPQHLLLMASVLRYIMSQKSILRKPELDAFLVTAFSPELLDTEYLARMKLDLVTSRGVQLAALFMEGVEMALLANDACGAPVPFLMCCPWLFFDGKLFHSKLRRAVSAKNLLEMCEHRMEVVVKVERMRQAILEGLVPEYNSPALPALMNNINMGPMRNVCMGSVGMGMGPMHMGNSNIGRGTWGNQYNGRGFFNGPMRYGGQSGLVARGGQLVVAGSVVGQWGANYGAGGQRLATGQRVRGNRGGKKNKEKRDKQEPGDEDVKVITVKELMVKEKD